MAPISFHSESVILDEEKLSGTVLRLLRPAPRLHGRFQTQSGYSPVNPGLSTKWRTACNVKMLVILNKK
jgi:hypothetical protein